MTVLSMSAWLFLRGRHESAPVFRISSVAGLYWHCALLPRMSQLSTQSPLVCSKASDAFSWMLTVLIIVLERIRCKWRGTVSVDVVVLDRGREEGWTQLALCARCLSGSPWSLHKSVRYALLDDAGFKPSAVGDQGQEPRRMDVRVHVAAPQLGFNMAQQPCAHSVKSRSHACAEAAAFPRASSEHWSS